MGLFSGSIARRRTAVAAGAGALAVGALVWFAFGRGHRPAHRAEAATSRPVAATAADGVVRLTAEQQRAIGLKVEKVAAGTASALVQAPGQVMPDETRYAYITPRAAGVVRSVAAHEGQNVKAGDLLATIDSPDVAQARFDLATQLQELEVAKSQADWERTVYENTLALLDRLKAGDSPEQIDKTFEDRPVGTSREQLIRAYASERLAGATFRRTRDLYDQKIIPVKQFDQARAELEAAEAAYQSLTESMSYTARLANVRAQQALRKAETATRVARARLRVLGVNPDGTLPQVRGGKVVGVRPDGTLEVPPPRAAKAEEVLHPDGTPGLTADGAQPAPASDATPAAPVEPIGARPEADPIAGPAHGPESLLGDKPVSTYPIWAPFDGTVIDRMMIVPGVSVELTSRLFTVADLSTVWVEAHVHESQYGAVAPGRDVTVTFTSPAYPGETFSARVLYTGDVVDPKTRTLRLVARAENPNRRLKPGMFVDVTLRVPGGRTAVLVPTGALLTEGDETLVFVPTGDGTFHRRVVTTGSTEGGRTEVLEGLAPGESVVVEGAFKLKAEWTLRRQEGSAAPAAAGDTRPSPAPGSTEVALTPAAAKGGDGR